MCPSPLSCDPKLLRSWKLLNSEMCPKGVVSGVFPVCFRDLAFCLRQRGRGRAVSERFTTLVPRWNPE